MTVLPRWRRWAVTLSQHAARVLLPDARSPWADAMRRELDYIEDDGAALRWALGCVVASYKARLTARPRFTRFMTTQDVLRHAAVCGALMLIIGFGLLERAESQTEPPRPAADESPCETPDAAPDFGRAPPSGMAGAGHPFRTPARSQETACASSAPARIPPNPTR